MSFEVPFTTAREAVLVVGRQRLHLRVWQPPKPRDTILMLHGLESHGGWFAPLGPRLARSGHRVVAIDRFGSGLSDGRRGDLPDWRLLTLALQGAIQAFAEGKEIYCLGYSWGARWALAHAVAHPRDLSGLILMAPAFFVQRSYSRAARLFALATKELPLLLRMPVAEDTLLTNRPEGLAQIARDTLRLNSVTTRLLFQSGRMERIYTVPGKPLQMPVLHLVAGADRISDNTRNSTLLRRRVGADHYTETIYPAADHALMYAPDDCDVAGDINRWIQAICDRAQPWSIRLF